MCKHGSTRTITVGSGTGAGVLCRHGDWPQLDGSAARVGVQGASYSFCVCSVGPPPPPIHDRYVPVLCSALTTITVCTGVVSQAWQVQHGRRYTAEEERVRLGVFAANAELVRRHNDHSNASWTMALNEFADLSHDEFVAAFVGGYRPRAHKGVGAAARAPALDALPASVDWVTAGAVTAVGNQGKCGACCTLLRGWYGVCGGWGGGAWLVSPRCDTVANRRLFGGGRGRGHHPHHHWRATQPVRAASSGLFGAAGQHGLLWRHLRPGVQLHRRQRRSVHGGSVPLCVAARGVVASAGRVLPLHCAP